MKKIIPEGTFVIFRMSTPPTGWTRDDSFADHSLQVTDASSSGGSVSFSQLFINDPNYSYSFSANSSSWQIGSTTLNTDTIPSHRHVFSPGTHWPNPAIASYRSYNSSTPSNRMAGGAPTAPPLEETVGVARSPSSPTLAGGGAHTHPLNNLLNFASISSSSKASFALKYVDVIRASRDS